MDGLLTQWGTRNFIYDMTISRDSNGTRFGGGGVGDESDTTIMAPASPTSGSSPSLSPAAATSVWWSSSPETDATDDHAPSDTASDSQLPRRDVTSGGGGGGDQPPFTSGEHAVVPGPRHSPADGVGERPFRMQPEMFVFSSSVSGCRSLVLTS